MTWLELAKEEASKAGLIIDDEAADYILWEYTGFPIYWDIPRLGATPEEVCRNQLAQHFKPVESEQCSQ
jgi:hypothetical protein